MTQRSKPWQFGVGDGLGLAADGSYTADEWDNIFDAAFGQGAPNYGVLRGYLNALRVYATTPASARVLIGSGGAFVNGKYFENDALVTFPIAPDPPFPPTAAATRYDRVVLRASWATRTVRLYRIAGAEGGGPGSAALVQIPGVTWDIPLARIGFPWPWGGTITAVDITDERCHIEPRQREFDAIVGDRPGDFATLTAALADNPLNLSFFIRNGNYNEPGDVTLTTGMWLCGEDGALSILDFGANQLILNTVPGGYSDHVLIENLNIKSANAGGSITMQRSRYCTVRRCVFDTTRGIVMTDDALEHIIADNRFDAVVTGAVIYLAGRSHIVRGNRILQGRIRCSGTSDGSTLCENVIEATGMECILIMAGADDIRIENNVITSTGMGILALGDDVVIVGNTLSACDDTGIDVEGDYGLVANNNMADGNGSGLALNGDYAIATGNQSHGNAVNGIVSGGIHNTITANICNSNTLEGIQATGHYPAIMGNQCGLNGDNGIYIGGDHGVCKGNVCAGNLNNGITCDGDQVVMGDNNCYGNTQWGVDYTGDRCIVLGNIALTNGAGQIDATGATNQIQDHNIVA